MFSTSRRREGRKRERGWECIPVSSQTHRILALAVMVQGHSSVRRPFSLSLLLLLRPKSSRGFLSLMCRRFTTAFVVSLTPASPSQIQLSSLKPFGYANFPVLIPVPIVTGPTSIFRCSAGCSVS